MLQQTRAWPKAAEFENVQCKGVPLHQGSNSRDISPALHSAGAGFLAGPAVYTACQRRSPSHPDV